MKIVCLAVLALGSVPSPADGLCPAIPPPPDDAGPDFHIEAGRAQGRSERSVELSRDVVLSRSRQRVYAGRMSFDAETSRAHISDTFLYDGPLLRMSGREGTVDMRRHVGSFSNVEYLIRANGGRGGADKVRHDEKESELINTSYSTCPDDNPVWGLSVDSLRLDHRRGQGVARNAWLKLYRVPVLYAPVFPFPLGTKRSSGFLAPRLRVSGYTGFDIAVPYYIDLAPDKDTTLTVRGMAKRGLSLGGEYRYLAERGDGEVYAEVNPAAAGGERDRGYLRTRLRHRVGPGTASAAVERLSDRDYFEDYGGGNRYLPFLGQRVDWSGHIAGAHVVFGADTYQVLQANRRAEEEPYDQLPFVRLRYRHPFGSSGVDMSLRSEWAQFRRDVGKRGWRLHVRPSLGAVWRRGRFWVRPRLAADALMYGINGSADSPPTRWVPAGTVDSGFLFAGGRSLFSREWSYALSPRLVYRYVPYRRQDGAPLFDTAVPAVTASSLFFDNRYTGPDRIGDEHSLTASLEADLWRRSGRETVRWTIGRKLYLRDRRLTLPGDLSPSARQTPLFQQLTAHLGNWSVSGRWDTGGGKDHGNYGLRVRHETEADRYWELWHREIPVDTRSPRTLLRYNIPWSQRLQLQGRADYVWPTSSLYSMTVNLDIRFCCWRMVVGVRRRSGGEERNRSVNELFLQINLSGLSPEKK